MDKKLLFLDPKWLLKGEFHLILSPHFWVKNDFDNIKLRFWDHVKIARFFQERGGASWQHSTATAEFAARGCAPECQSRFAIAKSRPASGFVSVGNRLELGLGAQGRRPRAEDERLDWWLEYEQYSVGMATAFRSAAPRDDVLESTCMFFLPF